MGNSNLHKAKIEKKDEFYTRYVDIEVELQNYDTKYFKDKVIYCPCDVGVEGLDIPKSNFIKYFENNKDRLGYKKLIHTSIQEGYDFRSRECEKYFEEADIVVTNPPFSLFRDFVACLEKYALSYIIVGNQNAITYKEIFPLIKENKLWLGAGFKGNVGFFNSPYEDKAAASEHREGKIRVSGAAWFTNIDLDKRHEILLLVKNYNEQDYSKYDNYDAIDVSKTKDIPFDYDGVMGVPITFLYKYNADQFEILGCPNAKVLPDDYGDGMSQKFVDDYYANGGKATIQKGNRNLVYYDKQGKPIIPYARVLIRRK